MIRWIAASLLVLAAIIPAAHAQTIVCFGDSLTSGVGAPAGSSYPDYLRKDLAGDGYHATVLNQGVQGQTTDDAMSRVQAVLDAHPEIVVLELGPNDAIYRKPVATTEHNLDTMIETFQQAHIRVILAGIVLPPLFDAAYLKDFNPIYSAIAAKYKLLYVPSLLDGVYGVMGMMSSDYLHPNATGYEHVARTVLPYVEPLLRK